MGNTKHHMLFSKSAAIYLLVLSSIFSYAMSTTSLASQNTSVYLAETSTNSLPTKEELEKQAKTFLKKYKAQNKRIKKVVLKEKFKLLGKVGGSLSACSS